MANFEMANADNPEEIIAATQRSLVDALKEVIADLQKLPNYQGVPGLTWGQIDYLLEGFRNKMPKVIHQQGAM